MALHSQGRLSRVEEASPALFLEDMEHRAQLQAKAARFSGDRLRSLFQTLQITDLEKFAPITLVVEFMTLLATYSKGFTIIVDVDPFSVHSHSPENVLQLWYGGIHSLSSDHVICVC